MKKKFNLLALIEAMRPIQWIKNLAIFAAIILNGQLLNVDLFTLSLVSFAVFCLLSSSSYLINDLVDVDNDRRHPTKKFRPLARGDISKTAVFNTSLILLLLGLGLAITVNFAFFLTSVIFVIIQYTYSYLLKKKAILDIMGIALSFIIRAYAGEIATGYHLPIWIMLTVIFLSLFIASGKRRSELVKTGSSTRPALRGYGRSLLDFYSSIFAVSTMTTYAMFTFFAEKVSFDGRFHRFILEYLPNAEGRKWYMITILPVIFGIMRYGQIIFEMQQGERPEKVVATDIPLILSILTWGLMILAIVYVL